MNDAEKDLLITAAYCIIGVNAALKKFLERAEQEAKKDGEEEIADAIQATRLELY